MYTLFLLTWHVNLILRLIWPWGGRGNILPLTVPWDARSIEGSRNIETASSQKKNCSNKGLCRLARSGRSDSASRRLKRTGRQDKRAGIWGTSKKRSRFSRFPPYPHYNLRNILKFHEQTFQWQYLGHVGWLLHPFYSFDLLFHKCQQRFVSNSWKNSYDKVSGWSFD